jgi:hypothetical protein
VACLFGWGEGSSKVIGDAFVEPADGHGRATAEGGQEERDRAANRRESRPFVPLIRGECQAMLGQDVFGVDLSLAISCELKSVDGQGMH